MIHRPLALALLASALAVGCARDAARERGATGTSGGEEEQAAPVPREPDDAVRTEGDAIERAEGHRGELCGPDLSGAPESAARAWALEAGERAWIVLLTCFEGAYQPNGRLLYVSRDGRATPLELPIVGADGALATSAEVGRVEVRGGELIEISLDRGVGDCGRRVRARIEPRGRLVLVEERRRACDDTASPEGGPETWPLVPVVDSSRLDAH